MQRWHHITYYGKSAYQRPISRRSPHMQIYTRTRSSSNRAQTYTLAHTNSVYVFIGACEVRPTCARIAALRSDLLVCMSFMRVCVCISHEYPKSDLTELSKIDIAGHDDVNANDDENHAQRSRLLESRAQQRSCCTL